MKLINTKFLFSSALIATMISGCAQKTGNETYDQNQNAIIGTTLGAIAGVVLGNNVGGGSKSRNKVKIKQLITKHKNNIKLSI